MYHTHTHTHHDILFLKVSSQSMVLQISESNLGKEGGLCTYFFCLVTEAGSLLQFFLQSFCTVEMALPLPGWFAVWYLLRASLSGSD